MMTPGSAINILSIDADENYARMLGDFFHLRNYNFFHQKSTVEPEIIMRENINVVIISSAALQSDGYQVIKSLLEKKGDLKIIVLLELWNDLKRLKISQTDISAFFDKPTLSLKKLDQTLKKFFHNKTCDKYGNFIKVLVVDDDPDVCEFIKSFFEDRSLEVYAAQNGRDALRIVKECNPHIILLDVKMPQMNGMVVLKQSKKISSDIEVIMVSGVDEQGLKKQAECEGASGYIHKPVVLNELERIVFDKVKTFN